MTDFLDEKKREMATRLDELRPLVDEYHRLEGALQALGGVTAAGEPAPPAARSKRRATSTRRGRPKGTGSRAAETLELVRGQPGITIPQLADRMGIKQNYLYRVLPGLEQEGQVRKDGRGWHPTAA